MCEWGTAKPWLWAKNIGNVWRTTGDIWDSFDKNDEAHSWAHPVTNIVDLNEPLWPFASPGHWNDADMLEVGNGGMSPAEYRAHFSLWAMMASPLMAGNDIAKMDQDTRSILLNREVIAVDQDKLGVQGHRVAKDGTAEIWLKTLADGGVAVLLFNRGEQAATITATAEQIGWPAKERVRVRDLWAHRDVRLRRGGLTATVEPHGVAMFRLLRL
jgi:alpha-galactosidase